MLSVVKPLDHVTQLIHDAAFLLQEYTRLSYIPRPEGHIRLALDRSMNELWLKLREFAFWMVTNQEVAFTYQKYCTFVRRGIPVMAPDVLFNLARQVEDVEYPHVFIAFDGEGRLTFWGDPMAAFKHVDFYIHEAWLYMGANNPELATPPLVFSSASQRSDLPNVLHVLISRLILRGHKLPTDFVLKTRL